MRPRAMALGLTAGIVVAVSAVAFTQAQTPAKPAGVILGDTVTVTAKIEAIDKKDRVLALRGPAGNIMFVEVGDAVKNFNQIKVGDQIRAEYYEALAVYLGKPGTQPEDDAGAIIATAAPGKKPGMYAVGAVDESVIVKAVDRTKRTLTVTGPAGYSYTVKVDDALSAYDQVNVGDTIHLRYVEGIAIAVEKP